MDRRTMELRNNMLEFLDICRDSTKSPVDDKTQEAIQAAVDSIGDHRETSELTPGQRQALEVSGPIMDDVQFDEASDLSPGQRAARNL